MKVDIIRKTEFVARDKEGNEYPLLNFNQPKYEQIEHADVEGILVASLKAGPTRYSYFKIFSSSTGYYDEHSMGGLASTERNIEYKCSKEEYIRFYKTYLERLQKEVKKTRDILNNKVHEII